MPSFDIISKTDLQEVDNALNSMTREISERYDFKGTKFSAERNKEEITIIAEDDYKLKAVHEALKIYLTRRNLDVKCLEFKEPEKASGNTLRQVIKIKQGIETEIAKKITKHIKDSKMKVQASIRGEEVRVEGKKRDDLQEAMAAIKAMNLELPIQFSNFRD